MMDAYIDQKATVESLNAMKPFLRDRGQVQLLRRIMNHIGKIPIADVVPVVRCEDCKWYGKNEYNWEDEDEMFCKYWTDWLPTYPDDFCSYGERKDGD